MNILDLGCGKPEQKTVGAVGIDINPNYSPDILLDLNKNNIPFEDNYFDEVHSNDSIEHFESPIHIFQEVYRVLKPGGKFTANTVNVDFILIKLLPFDHNLLWRHKIGTERTCHLVHFTPDMLKMYFQLTGFTNIKTTQLGLLHYNIYGLGEKPK